jgi:cytosine deaminase
MIAHVAQLTLPHELEQAMSMVTENAAKAARVDDYGIAPGKCADLVVVGATSVHEAIRLQPLRRHVIKGGREVARSVVSQERKLAAPPEPEARAHRVAFIATSWFGASTRNQSH